MTYIAPTGADELIKEFKLRLYGVLRTKAAAMEGTTEMRITRKYCDTRCVQVWNNLHAAFTPDSVWSPCCLAIHDVIPTIERLLTIVFSDTCSCSHCGKQDSLQRRIVTCWEGPVIWHWTRKRNAAIHRKNPEQVPVEWTLRLVFQLCSFQRHAAVLWILDHLTPYRQQD
jgi:hypothetical protein